MSRTLGILTILYALALIGYGFLNLALANYLPQLGGLFGELQAEQVESQQERRRMALDLLTEREAKSTTPEAKAQVKVDRLLLERVQPTPLPGTSIPGLGMFNDPRARNGLIVDTSIKLGLNVMLLVAGIGIARGRGWGRSMGLGVSWLKIAGLIVLTLVSLRTVVPPMADAWTADMVEMMTESMGRAEVPEGVKSEVAGFKSAMVTSFASIIGLFAAFGLVFPIVMIVMLNQPKLRAELAPKPTA